MLAKLQKQLTDIYQVDRGLDVRDYLITDPRLARLLGQQSLMPNTEESVLLAQDSDGLALSVYLNQELLDRLDEANPMANLQLEQLNDFWIALEGVSHFNYLVWSASKDRSVTLLELELQAEVDKFVMSLLLVSKQGHIEFARQLHALQFEVSRIKPDLDQEQYERYTAASDYAGRFCHHLRERLIDSNERALSELRQFYRLTQTDKISHIHSQAWASS
ncbi:MAG: hypothetical protein IIC12_08545 [Proteobacteria bacterium]|nr:hypothetical protein [Pseudomonadota bacterium]